MHFNRFDIIEAHYWFCAHYHGGRGTKEYYRLFRISNYFIPGLLGKGPKSENAKRIYGNLVEKHIGRYCHGDIDSTDNRGE